MIRWETGLTSNTFSIDFSATNFPTPAVPLLFPDQNSLYLESLPLIIRQWPPRYLVSWTQQRSTFLQDSVSTTSQTLPFRVFTLRVPTLKFLRCLLDLPQWPDPAPRTWEGAKPETPLTEILFLPASSNVTTFVESAMFVLEHLSYCPCFSIGNYNALTIWNHISVPIGQIWFILGTNDKYHGLSISYKFRQNRPLNTGVIALVLI